MNIDKDLDLLESILLGGRAYFRESNGQVFISDKPNEGGRVINDEVYYDKERSEWRISKLFNETEETDSDIQLFPEEWNEFYLQMGGAHEE